MKSWKMLLVCCLISVTAALENTNAQSSEETDDSIPVVDAAEKQVEGPNKEKIFSLGLKWNESGRAFAVRVKNDGTEVMKILGVQASGGLYVGRFQSKVQPGTKGKIPLFLLPESGGSSEFETVSVLTSVGIKRILVVQDRESVIDLSSSSLNWGRGEAIASKVVNVKVNLAAEIKIIGVRPARDVVSASLTDLGGGNYSVTVTPKSTDRDIRVPVFIETNPNLPGRAPMVLIQIGSGDLN